MRASFLLTPLLCQLYNTISQLLRKLFLDFFPGGRGGLWAEPPTFQIPKRPGNVPVFLKHRLSLCFWSFDMGPSLTVQLFAVASKHGLQAFMHWIPSEEHSQNEAPVLKAALFFLFWANLLLFFFLKKTISNTHSFFKMSVKPPLFYILELIESYLWCSLDIFTVRRGMGKAELLENEEFLLPSLDNK